MGFTVFYSWQDDSPRKPNRYFIKKAIKSALAEISAEVTVEDSPRFDAGMEGVSGTPEVANVIFTKIKKCFVFIADTTLVGSIPSSKPDRQPKRVPNPNVLLEMGYAAGKIGWERIICVMNTAMGGPEEQPFDLRNKRFPIVYNSGRGQKSELAAIQEALAKELKNAIETTIRCEHEGAQEAIENLDADCIELMHKWRGTNCFHFRQDQILRVEDQALKSAIIRLLGLKLLRYDFSYTPEGMAWAYHWTALGKLVLKKLCFRSE